MLHDFLEMTNSSTYVLEAKKPQNNEYEEETEAEQQQHIIIVQSICTFYANNSLEIYIPMHENLAGWAFAVLM